VAAASLSNRYIPSRQLPDKAIDLIDEAASRLRMEIDSPSRSTSCAATSTAEARRAGPQAEKDAASKERLATLRETLKVEQARLDELQARWERERASLNAVGDLKTRLDQARAERAARGQLSKASRLYYAEIPALERQVAQAENAEAAEGGERMVNEQVTDADIAAVIAAWTGIPVGRLLQGEREARTSSRARQAADRQKDA
jgi:ATP-dependent Clp protease ATP-binding subunit ClpB